MSKLSYRDGIAILQLVIFAPCMILSLFLWIKHGLKAKPRCWRYIFILATLRVGGSICQLLQRSVKSEGVIVATLLFDLIGISPLSLACIGQVERMLVRTLPYFERTVY